MIHELKAGVLHYYVVVLYKELLFLRAKVPSGHNKAKTP